MITMSKEMNFFIYLLEKYADKKNKNASDILKEWDKLNITFIIIGHPVVYQFVCQIFLKITRGYKKEKWKTLTIPELSYNDVHQVYDLRHVQAHPAHRDWRGILE